MHRPRKISKRGLQLGQKLGRNCSIKNTVCWMFTCIHHDSQRFLKRLSEFLVIEVSKSTSPPTPSSLPEEEVKPHHRALRELQFVIIRRDYPPQLVHSRKGGVSSGPH